MLWNNGQPANSENFVLDDGFWFGRGVFETIRVHQQPLFWAEHISRLNQGLIALQVRAAVDADQILAQLAALEIRHCVLKIAVTADNIVFQTRALPESGAKPFRLLPVENQRTTNKILLGCKSLNYLENLLARDQAAREGFDDVLFVDNDGQISETSRANLFFVRAGKICTTDLSCGLLNGVIRQWVLANYAVETGDYSVDEFLAADAVFVTNSVIGIQAVNEIGDKVFGASKIVEDIKGQYESSIKDR